MENEYYIAANYYAFLLHLFNRVSSFNPIIFKFGNSGDKKAQNFTAMILCYFDCEQNQLHYLY